MFSRSDRVAVISVLFGLLLASGSVFAKDKDKTEHLYPNATRVEPKTDVKKESDQKALQKAIDDLNSGDEAKAQEEMQAILTTSSSKYAQGLALQVLANVKFNAQDYKGAIENYKKVIALDALPNDGHFDSMFNLANAYVADEQYQPALDELKVWREQGKRETADSYALEGNVYYRLEKYPEAITAIKKAQSLTDKPKDSWNTILMAAYSSSGQGAQASSVIETQLAKDPNNKKLLHDAIVVYVQSNQYDKALALLDREHVQGLLTEESDYKLAAQLYDQSEKPAAGAKILKEGFDKGVVKPSYEMYKLLGDSFALGQDDKSAIDAYAKASPLAKDGYVDYVRGSLLLNNDRAREAIESLKQGIAKGGLKKPGEAYIMLGDAYNQIDANADAAAAWQKAKAYPESQKMADQRLHAGGGVKLKPKKS
ncbi:MAG: tetratricopeptide repeat protein [Rudaea sp.]